MMKRVLVSTCIILPPCVYSNVLPIYIHSYTIKGGSLHRKHAANTGSKSKSEAHQQISGRFVID